MTQNLPPKESATTSVGVLWDIHRKHAVLKVPLTPSKPKEYKGYKQRGGEVQKESREDVVRRTPQSNECSLRDHSQLVEKRRRVCSA